MTPTGSAVPQLPADETDPRKLRSRTRLLDAASELLRSGGLDAVTIDAVTRMSKVARTTLYRHFENAVQLRAATLERLLPPPVVQSDPEGSLRDQLVELVIRQAAAVNEVPLPITTMAWLATGAGVDTKESSALRSLRERLIQQYREPFDHVLDTPGARAQLGDYDQTLALLQLIGPIAFAKLTGIGNLTPEDCAGLVDDFLAARAAEKARSSPGSRTG